ncbi:hypothetical protein G2W53_041722 [Senna tora]|uniref:Transposase-associated domain-containing protein n=1 Tax=Senna tora TaxID=362788 RepID=A0A834W1Q2_9FABA|nr:hypothetical protein G2W53_041722 [Senna tora]
MRPDRSWILRRKEPSGRVSEEFMDGVEEFLKLVNEFPINKDSLGRILCPCGRCKNCVRKDEYTIERHLYYNGFVEGYLNWTIHGENAWGGEGSAFNDATDDEDTRNPYVDMVVDAARGRLDPNFECMEEDPNPSASKFYQLLEDADEPLWDGCYNHTKLSAVSQLLNLKSEFNMSQSCFDRMLVIIKMTREFAQIVDINGISRRMDVHGRKMYHTQCYGISPSLQGSSVCICQRTLPNLMEVSGSRVNGEWWAACKVRAKLFKDETLNSVGEVSNEFSTFDYYQDDESLTIHDRTSEEEEINLLDAHGLMEEVNVDELPNPMNASHTDQFIDDDEETDHNEFLDSDEELFDSDSSSDS